MRIFFSNGYGISIVRNDLFTPIKDDLYEIALLKGTRDNYKLVHEAVHRNLTDEQVTEAVRSVQETGMPI